MSAAGGVRTGPIWQKRFCDFNVCSTEKRIEKLRYMHRNPVKRALVEAPEEWKWRSFRGYACREAGLVRVNCQEWPLRIAYSASRSHSFENRE
jgi:putative transposase